MSLGANKQALMGAAGAAGGGADSGFYTHQIASSLRNSSSQNGTLKRTAGTPTNSTKFTMSYWVKRYNDSGPSEHNLVFTSGTGGASYIFWGFAGTDFDLQTTGGNWSTGYLTSDAMYRDTSAYYHHVLTFDSTQSTQADRLKIYVNGERIISFSVESVTSGIGSSEAFSFINQSGVVQAYGGLSGSGHGTEGADNQMAEIVFNDGQSYGPDSYGETKNGVWIPKDPSGLTFGNNGYWLKMAAGARGTDSSGNGNNFTVNNIPEHDVMLDSPTFNSDSNGGNFLTWNPLSQGSYSTIREGNLITASNTGADASYPSGNICFPTGKWYMEYLIGSQSETWPHPGLVDIASSQAQDVTRGYFWALRYKYNGVVEASSGDVMSNFGTVTIVNTGVAAYSPGDIISWYVDADNKKAWVAKNGTIPNSGNPATGAYPQIAWTGTPPGLTIASGVYSSYYITLNAGSDGTFAGTKTAQGNKDTTGYGNFYYAPPSGFLAVCTGNLPIADSIDPAQTDDDFPKELFFMSEYAGNSSGRTITTENQPDWMWIRHYTQSQDWYVFDSTRVITDNKVIITNTTALESTLPQSNVTSVGSTSVGISSGSWLNSPGSTYQMWMWRANGGTTSTNTTGSANSTVQVDPSGGFSIVKWTGTSDSWGNAITLGHGLSRAPTCIIAKKYAGNADDWTVFFSDYGAVSSGGSTAAHANLVLNTDGAIYTNQSYKSWGGVMPTSSVFTVDGNNLNGASDTIIAYCFANTDGYIKSGTYKGNANTAQGPFVYTGFKPAFVLNKPLIAGNWRQQDISRSPFNVTQSSLTNNSTAAEDTGASVKIDLLSNGFKMRDSSTPWNQATTYVYLAFAENPFKYATAR